MSQQTIKKYPDLKKRIGQFLSSSRCYRDEIREFIETVKPLGELVIIGGMLRDLSLSGSGGFNSDVDFVIQIDDFEKLESALSKFIWTKNKFGGYRGKTGVWFVDLGTFDSTWAFREG